jgi:carboxymethylenebutenolidase
MAADIQTQTVTFPGEQVTLTGFLARPSTPPAGGAPAVVIIHEWWGLNDHMKDIARRFAAEGFVALAVDCYSRLGHKVTTDATEAAKLMESLSTQQILTDLNATTRYLTQQPFVDSWKLAAVGFCMGGTFALMMASHNSDIKAAVPFYGQRLISLTQPTLHRERAEWPPPAPAGGRTIFLDGARGAG